MSTGLAERDGLAGSDEVAYVAGVSRVLGFIVLPRAPQARSPVPGREAAAHRLSRRSPRARCDTWAGSF
jgi:hypothetical protein